MTPPPFPADPLLPVRSDPRTETAGEACRSVSPSGLPCDLTAHEVVQPGRLGHENDETGIRWTSEGSHPSPAAPTEARELPPIEQDLWWGHLCPALANIDALKQAQSELMALGTDWAEAGRILSRVQSFYVDAAHAAAQRYLEAVGLAVKP